MHRVQIGVVYPQIELGGDPTAVRRFGRAVEELGFDYLLAYDHVLGAVHAGRTPRLTGPYTERDPFHDPFVMFAYLAGMTERIGFATGVLILPQRQTALVARQAADVDLLSGGRLRLGVGVGWSPVEYQALGQDFRSRGARQEEQIELLRRLFTEPVVDFVGRFDRVDRAALVPKPARSVPKPGALDLSDARGCPPGPASTPPAKVASASTSRLGDRSHRRCVVFPQSRARSLGCFSLCRKAQALPAKDSSAWRATKSGDSMYLRYYSISGLGWGPHVGLPALKGGIHLRTIHKINVLSRSWLEIRPSSVSATGIYPLLILDSFKRYSASPPRRRTRRK